MHLSREELGALFEHIVKRQRPGIQPDPAAVDAAYEEAERLTRGHPEDEPAALFLALALDRLRVLRQAIEWEELRASFAQRLRPIGTGEITPPRRPR